MAKLRLLSLNLFLWLSVALLAQTYNRAAYYKTANGKMKADLKTALSQIISEHDVKDYGSLWKYYYLTDRRADNTVIDRYSYETFEFTEQGVTVPGMDKEHGFPKSWWGGDKIPAYTDLHHLMPSEHYANLAKSNYGMGIVTQPLAKKTEIWDNGCIKVGRGQAGNNGLVSLWEPADEWKGDFARAYFYVVTCYEDLEMVQGEGANSMSTGRYPKLQEWAYKLYLKWSRQDPVSDVERVRNDSVFSIQGNRNPFIDFDGLEQYIWGTHMETAFNASAYENPFDGTIPEPEPEPDPEPIVEPDPQPILPGDYVRVTEEPEDWTGTYLIVYEGEGAVFNGNLDALDVAFDTICVTINDNVIAQSEKVDAAAFTIEPVDGGYSIRSQKGQYIGRTKDDNGLETSTTNAYVNTLQIDDEGEVGILSTGGAYLRFNAASNQKRFRYYKSSTYDKQKVVALYQRTKAQTGDVNGDGILSIADVTALVNIVLSREDAEAHTYHREAADVNADGTVSIADVTVLVNIILKRTNE